MVFLNINSEDNEKIKELENIYNSPAKIFMLIYMDGCGPCNETKPEWKKIENVLSKYNNSKNIAIIDIEHQILEKANLKNFVQPSGFPTILYINNREKENYEDSPYLEDNEKDRKIDSFVKWIENTLNKSDNNSDIKDIKGGRKTRRKKSRKSRKTKKQRGGKWSKKYKRSINCKRPKGFSQKQYCKYGRK
jgi:vacuolar-type H+-ATPase subunit F/Vma7